MTASGLRLRVLGSSPSVPRPRRACSAYLVEDDRTAVLLDCGTGALAALRDVRDYATLDAVAVTHMHADHFFDLVPLRYGLTYGPSLRSTPLPLWLPPGGEAALRAATAPFARDRARDFLAAFDVRTYSPQSNVEVGSLTLSFAPVEHYVEAFAIRVRSGSTTLAYSGDSAPCRQLVDLARGVDAFLCEASLGTGSESGRRGHSSAREAGEMARAAGVGALALTHYPAEVAPAALCQDAARAFDGSIVVVDDGMVLPVGSG